MEKVRWFFSYIVRDRYDHVYDNTSPAHIVLFALFVFGFCLILKMAKHPLWKRRLAKIEKLTLAGLVFSQGIYLFWFLLVEVDGDKWPLYVCRLAVILIVITYFVHWEALEQYAIYTALYGGISSVFLSSPKAFAFPHVTRLAYFGTHICLAYAALLRILLHREKIGWKSLLESEVVNIVTIAVVFGLNLKFDWNYMFLMSPGVQVVKDLPRDSIVSALLSLTVMLVYLIGDAAAWLFALVLQRKFGLSEEAWPRTHSMRFPDRLRRWIRNK